MRVAVLGAGAVGGTLAALLDRAGHSLEVTARGAHLAAIQASGLRLTGAWGDHVAAVWAGDALAAVPDLAILATKAHDAEAALRPNAALLDGVPLVVVQNGLAGLERAAEAAPGSPLVGGLALFAASLSSPGEITVTAAAGLCLGGDDDAALELAARAFDDVLSVTRTDDFAGAQWTKLVINQVNALPAITGLSVQQVVADRALRRILTLGMLETVRVGRAKDVTFAPLQHLDDRVLRRMIRLPVPFAELVPRKMAARMGDVPNPASTLQSIRRGAATEIDHLAGAVVDAAHGTGVPVPVNAAMVELVHEVERTGRFLTPEEVVVRLDSIGG
ncbi:ketopantoate reductase family protein [Lysobacter korlensis]|uniref:2-dehydropantoate 2-reductase n=1 Tax=Lysobacter korlensis TaxID=553636 RepID=A0ABV6RY44_9GAMM